MLHVKDVNKCHKKLSSGEGEEMLKVDKKTVKNK